MIDELPPNVRALVSAGRGPLSPDAATVARMRANIHVAVGIGVAAGTGAAAATGTSAVLGKVAAIALAVTAATVGSVAYVRHVKSDPAVAPTLSVSTTTTTTGAPADDLEIMPTVIAVEREPMPAPDLISDTPEAVSPAIAPPPIAPAPAPAPVPSATLAREIELVDQATQALRRGDHAGVLAAVRTYETETSGHGQLAEDAAAIALEAACTSKDPDAATKLAAFTKRWPQSAQRARLTAVCHEGATP